MKDLTRECEVLFSVKPDEASSLIDFALDCLWDDPKHSIHDRVAGVMFYEELMGALLSAKKRISDLERERNELQSDVSRLEGEDDE
jgi:hypothetical protein